MQASSFHVMTARAAPAAIPRPLDRRRAISGAEGGQTPATGAMNRSSASSLSWCHSTLSIPDEIPKTRTKSRDRRSRVPHPPNVLCPSRSIKMRPVDTPHQVTQQSATRRPASLNTVSLRASQSRPFIGSRPNASCCGTRMRQEGYHGVVVPAALPDGSRRSTLIPPKPDQPDPELAYTSFSTFETRVPSRARRE